MFTGLSAFPLTPVHDDQVSTFAVTPCDDQASACTRVSPSRAAFETP